MNVFNVINVNIMNGEIMKSILREKHRYVGFLLFPQENSRDTVASAVRFGLLRAIGEIGYAKADPRVLYVSKSGMSAILRCTHGEADTVRSALSFITKNISGSRVHFMPIFTSGTILKCKTACAKAEKKHQKNN